MERRWKKLGSLLLTVCMVFTMLPTVAFADEGTITSKITDFTVLAEDIASQEVGTGTEIDKLTCPTSFEATVTTGPSFTTTIKEDIPVLSWAMNPIYDNNTAGTYVFTPILNLPPGMTLNGVEPPTITVTVKEADLVADLVSGTDWSINADGLLTITNDAGMTDWIKNRYVETNGTRNYELVKALWLGDDVTNILDSAFMDCSITSITVNSGNPNFSISAGGALLNKAGDTLFIFPFVTTGSYTVEAGITTIKDGSMSRFSTS